MIGKLLRLSLLKVVIIGLFFTSCSSDKNENHHIVSNKLDSYFATQLDTFKLVAISSAIIKNNKIVWTGSYGYKNLESKESVDPNTLFHQGSISKTITLAAFLHMIEHYNIGLDNDINDYLPFEVRNPNHENEPITFKMLLTHTSSFNDVNVGEKNNKLYQLYSNNDSTDKLEYTLKNILSYDGEYFDNDYFLKGVPGTEYTYSNIAYSLLGYVVERISGVPFTTYCQQNIFKPLEMSKTTFLLSETDTTNFAYQYYSVQDSQNCKIKIQPYTWPGYMDGSLRTTPLEYSNFLIMLINNGKFKGTRVVSKKTVKTMLNLYDLPGNQSTRMFQPAGRALLWNKVKNGDITFYHFNGFGAGFFTEVYFDSKTKIAGLIFTTGGFSSFESLGKFTEETITQMINHSDLL